MVTATRTIALRTTAARGFSLLEIMVVITLIGLVTATIGVAVMSRLRDGQEKTARSQCYEIAKGAEVFKLANGAFPTSAQGIAALASPPRGRPVLSEVPKDPWGRDFLYVAPGQRHPLSVDVSSRGEDGQEGTDDDVGNWPAAD